MYLHVSFLFTYVTLDLCFVCIINLMCSVDKPDMVQDLVSYIGACHAATSYYPLTHVMSLNNYSSVSFYEL